MSHRTPPHPSHWNTAPPGTCRWCNIEIGLTPKGKISKSRWHKKCFEEFKLLFWTSSTRNAVWTRDKGKCAGCGAACVRGRGSPRWQMDHIIPLIEADKSTYDPWKLNNLQTLCVSCHKIKTSSEATQRAIQRKLTK